MKRTFINERASRRSDARNRRRRSATTTVLLGALVGLIAVHEARGEGVAQVLTSKSLPPATVEVIDPESGSSSGTGGSDVKIAVGDIILFRFAFTPVPDKINRGIQSYLTEYIPANTEVVGVRFIDKNGKTVLPNYPGLAVRECGGGSLCDSFANLPCTMGMCSFSAGSIAQVHGDTGIFYSTDARTARTPNNAFITMDNGIQMTPEPRTISPGIVALLNDTTGPYYAHNVWDWIQIRAFGTQTAVSTNGGTGNTPHRYGSMVAGPQTHYDYEATETSPGVIRFNNVQGPWRRIFNPGSLVGTGNAIAGSDNTPVRTIAPFNPATAFDVTPASAVAAKAVRFAMGETRTGEASYVEVALRVTGVPIDPTYGGTGGNVDCGEVVGSDVASRSGNSGGRSNPWPTYIGSPACVFLKLLFDLQVDKTLAVGGDTLNYTLKGKNLSVNPETNAVVRLKFDSSRQSYSSATPAPTSGPATCVDDSTKQCLTWNLGNLAPSDEYQINAAFTVGGGGQTTNVMVANYQSTQLPAPGFSTQALSIVTGIAVPKVSLATVAAPTVTAATAGGTAALAGTVRNAGTNTLSYASLKFYLPTGWSINGSVVIGGVTVACSTGCGTNQPLYNFSSAFAPGESRPLTLSLNVPGSAATSLYTMDVQVWGGQSGFGGNFETYFNQIATIPVGAVRTAKPVLTCPIGSTSTSISGTSEADATVDVLFNLMDRGTAVASGAGAWTSNDFGAFGGMYGGLEVRARAQAPGKLESELSDSCEVTAVRACSDGLDNDMDGLIDFPADPGCDSLTDGDETDPALPQCSDMIDNDADMQTDWPQDLGCQSADDPTEDNTTACNDNVDNDGDGLIDYDGNGTPALIDPDCTGPNDPSEVFYRQCQDGIDNDADGRIDFDGLGNALLVDPGCHSAFDDSEIDDSYVPPDIKPRLLIVFDSSGSMNWNTCNNEFTGGDGSLACGGSDVDCTTCPSDSCENGLADDSRLYKVKEGISNVIAAFGEIEYSLMRFHQRGDDFGCPDTNASRASGGWQGGGAAPCGGGFNAGDLLVGFANENEQLLLDWMDGDDNYPGIAPKNLDLEIRGSGTTPLAGSLASARDYLAQVRAADPAALCRPYRVILVTDGQETCGGNAPQAAADLFGDGVTVNVVGFATPDPGVIAGLDAIANAGSGGSRSAILVNDAAGLSTFMAQLITDTVLVELCNGADDDCDGLIDEDFLDLGDACSNGEKGICLEPGVRVCRLDQLGTVCNAPPGTPGTEICNALDDDCNGLVDDGLTGCNCVPTQEICNGLDDNCNGMVDEGTLPGVGDACGLSIGECTPGALICDNGALVCDGGQGPVTEICDTKDNDCDTFIDEYSASCYTFSTGCTIGSGCLGDCRLGVETCTAGGGVSACMGQVGPIAELCNGRDDDCDGTPDEDFTLLGMACDNGQQGVCRQTGVYVCSSDGSGVVCTAPTVTPGTEVCNGLDDDCDGTPDDNLGAPINTACGGGGSCTPGVLECVMGVPTCVGAGGGGLVEVCNGKDDDCDSFVDEEPLAGTGGDCTDPGFGSFADIGECEFGEVICAAGGFVCDGYVGPKPEVCNGLDDDCDGVGDNDAQCPGGSDACIEGACVSPCQPSEFPCPFGFFCKNLTDGDFCVVDPCASITCGSGEFCDSNLGACVDYCDGVNCQTGQQCMNGLCLDCFVLGCPSGELCIAQMTGVGVCEPNLCFGVMCESNEFCRDGDCIPVDCNPACPDGQICQEGVCRIDLCADVTCPNGTLCDPDTGDCENNECTGVNCLPGNVCRPKDGVCIPDPCLTISCQDGYVCELRLDGTATCSVDTEIPEDEKVFAGGGGCGCATTNGGGNSGATLLFLIGACLAATRRRRRRAA